MKTIKIWRSPKSKFGIWVEHPDDLQHETYQAQFTYTDAELQRIAADGFNGIWIHGQLQYIIKNSHFPEFAPNGEKQLQAIKTLCLRAAKYGIKVYLYMQPPRAIPVSDTAFWSKYSDLAGQFLEVNGDDNKPFAVTSICTSTQYVRDYLFEAFALLTAALPELGGIIIISASEYPAHCYSRRNIKENSTRKHSVKMALRPCECPRCKLREPEEVVIELLNTIRDGVRSVSQDMKLIFWNWGWLMYIDPPCGEIISRLPQDCTLLVDFERGGYREDGHFINEYSLGYAGPSEQFVDSMQIARQRGMEVMAKMQFGTTHEIATVRSMPLIGNIFKKIHFIKTNKLAGFMGCWNFGNLKSANTAAVNFFMDLDNSVGEKEALTAFAESYFPNCNSEKCVAAWESFAETMKKYPFTMSFMYYGVINHALGVLPPPGKVSKPVGRSWLPEERGDDYKSACNASYPLERIIETLNYLAEKWQTGVDLLAEAIGFLDTPEAKIEYGNAVICGKIFAAAANLYELYQLKLNWKDSDIAQYNRMIAKHKEILRAALPYVKNDPEQGFHIEGRFFSFNAEIIEKILNS